MINPVKPDLFKGRTKLYTSLTPEELNGPNALELLTEELTDNILPMHAMNAAEEDYLLNYYAGMHPGIAERLKETRGEIDNKIMFNFGKSFTRDIVSYFLSKPIQYVQREGDNRENVVKLNNAFDAEDKSLIDYEIANYMSIVGVGYRGVFTETNPVNGTHLCLAALDPRCTFVVWSPDKTLGAQYCGTVYVTPPKPANNESKTVYTIYTKTMKYVFEVQGSNGMLGWAPLVLKTATPANLNGNLPIVEYDNSILMLGDWESEISIMDAIDVLGSDCVNDIEQFVNSILLAQGFELDEDTLTTLEQNKILNIPDVPPGVEVVVKYIAEQLDASGAEDLRDWLEGTMRSIVGVPDRKTRSGGGDTGDAVYMRDGWQDIDLVANAKERFFISADRKALATAITILQIFNELPKDFTAYDVEIKFSRNKQTNLLAKAQTYGTLVGAAIPIDQTDALILADLTNNVDDIVERSQAAIKEAQTYQESRSQLNYDRYLESGYGRYKTHQPVVGETEA